jgi:general secretion pathway protein D
MRQLTQAVCLLALVAILAACDEGGPTRSQFSNGAFGSDSKRNAGVARNARGADAFGKPFALQRGDGVFFDADAMQTDQRNQAIVIPHDGNMVELSLVNASIAAAAQEVLGKTLGLTYVLSEDVTGKITIQSTRPLPKQALFNLFQAALEANGATIEQKGGVVRIVRGSTGNRSFRTANGGMGDGGAIIVAPLEFVSPNEMIGLMQPLIDEGLRVVPDQRRNLILMSGAPDAIEAGLDALNIFDVDVMRGKSVALVPLRAAEPDALVLELNSIFESGEGGALQGVVEFVPNRRLGSILVISSKARYMDRARKWIRDLDQQAAGTSRFLHTYDLHNRNAEEVAPILDKLLSDGSASSGPSGADGENPQTGRSQEYKVAADTSRNALIVRATQEEHNEIAAMLRDLDTAARQVLLEATIAEVTLNDELNVGVRWYFENGDVGTRFSDLANGAVSGTYPGFSAILSRGGANVALNALASVTDVKVISAPTLMVVDNQEGVLQIGDQVPIARQTASDADTTAVVLTQVEYRDTGIILKVRPRIGVDGAVNLKIEQEVSDVSATRTSGIDSPTISTRKVATHAVLADGQTLTLGGLVQERDNKTRAEVPGLGRVPVLGGLFRTKDSSKDRTELLIMIRPRVIHNAAQASDVTAYWRSKLNGADTILSTGLGAPRHAVISIVR